jgi:hypothetical protein
MSPDEAFDELIRNGSIRVGVIKIGGEPIERTKELCELVGCGKVDECFGAKDSQEKVPDAEASVDDPEQKRAEWIRGRVFELHAIVDQATKGSEVLAAYEEMVLLVQEQHPEYSPEMVKISTMAQGLKKAIKIVGENPVTTWSIMGNLQMLLAEDANHEIEGIRAAAVLGRMQ